MRRTVQTTRAQALLHVQQQLERTSFPRLQMGMIVALTGGAGLLSSFLLLRAGLDAMVWRYPLALALAYAFFLFLLWLWLRTNAEDYVDVSDVPDLVPTGGWGDAGFASGRGGDFAGAGASASFDGTAPLEGASRGGVDKAAGALLDGDDFAVPLLAVVLAIGLAFASLYIVYVAPALLAELLFDGVLSYTLYRRLRGIDPRHWLLTAMRRTALAFGLTAVFVAVVGWALAAHAPGARSIGEVLHHAGAAR